MRAADLQNKICIFHPVEVGEWPAKGDEYDEEGNLTKQSQKASQYVSCDVWVLDRQGIVETGTEVRVSWWKAVAQLTAAIGGYVGAKPTQEQGGKAIYLVPLEGDAAKVAAEVVLDLEGESSDEPF